MLDCDLLAVSNGWNPTIHLASHQGHRPVWDPAISAFVAGNLPDGMSVAGSAAGRFSLARRLPTARGSAPRRRGTAALRPKQDEPAPTTDPETVAVTPVWRVAGARGKAFVDFQNDVTDKDIELAAREGFRSVEHLKRYTTLGMATDQGKTSNLAGLAHHGRTDQASRSPRPGVTMFRPPYTPVAIGALAGHHRGQDFRPVRLAPAHQWSKEAGAVFVESGHGGARNISPTRRERLADNSQSRSPRGAQWRRRLRCLDARQDRHSGRGRAGSARARLRQHLVEPARRQGALRPDAARRRLRHGRRHDVAAGRSPIS